MNLDESTPIFDHAVDKNSKDLERNCGRISERSSDCQHKNLKRLPEHMQMVHVLEPIGTEHREPVAIAVEVEQRRAD